MAGAPKRNRNAAHDKPWLNALQRAAAQYESGDIKAGQVLRRIADRVVKDALNGDRAAQMEIANRLDGKPTETVMHGTIVSTRDMDDSELAGIITEGRGSGVAGEASGESKPNCVQSVH